MKKIVRISECGQDLTSAPLDAELANELVQRFRRAGLKCHAEIVDNSTIKTGAQWADEQHLRIIDPAGWRHASIPWEQPITRTQFSDLLMSSQFEPLVQTCDPIGHPV